MRGGVEAAGGVGVMLWDTRASVDQLEFYGSLSMGAVDTQELNGGGFFAAVVTFGKVTTMTFERLDRARVWVEDEVLLEELTEWA